MLFSIKVVMYDDVWASHLQQRNLYCLGHSPPGVPTCRTPKYYKGQGRPGRKENC